MLTYSEKYVAYFVSLNSDMCYDLVPAVLYAISLNILDRDITAHDSIQVFEEYNELEYNMG